MTAIISSLNFRVKFEAVALVDIDSPSGVTMLEVETLFG